MTAAINWPVEIARMWGVKQEIAALDTQRIYQHSAPAVKATADDIRALQRAQPALLDSSYLSFLAYSDGWANFLQNTNLLGTKDFAARDTFERTLQELAYRLPLKSDRFDFTWTVDNCIPIGASDRDIGVFVVEANKTNAKVGWIITDEVDAYESFAEFFVSMIEYNKHVAENLRSRNKTIGHS
jgi:hypothetical protein